MRDIASLTEGGVISTALPQDSPIRVLIGSQDRFVGSAGRVGLKLAVQVTDAASTEGPVNGGLASTQFNPTFANEAGTASPSPHQFSQE